MGGFGMFSEINQKLVETKGALRKRDKYRIQLADYEQELEAVEEKLTLLRSQLQSEQKDVEKLEGISLTNLIATLAGNKDEKLSKEKQEMLAAQHKLSEAEKTKTEINDAILSLEQTLGNLDNVEQEYQQLLRQKEEMIKNSSSPYASKMFEWIEQEGILQSQLTELKEAIDAGERVKASLSSALKSLEKAGGWGQLDMFGGGTVSGIIKHQHINEAEESLHRAQTRMRHFQKELLDIKEQIHLEVNISEMLRFADFFFDGFIADFMVQNRINSSVTQTKQHYKKVNDLLLKLNENFMEHQNKLDDVQKEKLKMVETL
jgi:hypothetical protein